MQRASFETLLSTAKTAPFFSETPPFLAVLRDFEHRACCGGRWASAAAVLRCRGQ